MKRKPASAAAKAILAAAVLSTTAIPSAFAVDQPSVTPSTTTTPAAGSNTTGSTATATGPLVLTAFTDIAKDHWAYRHVSKLNLLNIVKGVTANTFAPDSNVKQQDAIIMAIRLMGLEKDAEKYVGSAYVTGLDVEYGSQYILMAREKGLINLREEQEALGQSSGESVAWGAREATREWLAKILIRAIGKEDLATKLAGTASTFTDSKDIASSYTGFVNAAVELKLITGFADRSFQPKGKVTRAQIVTMLSRAEPLLEGANSLSRRGIVIESNSQKLKLQDKNGKVTELSYTLDAIVFEKTGGALPAGPIKQYAEVSVIGRGSHASYVEVLNDDPQLEILEGKLVQLNVGAMEISVSVNGKQEAYPLLSTVTAQNAEGSGLSLAQLTPGSTVQLKRISGSASNPILSIVATKLSFNKVSSGPILRIDRTNNRITIQAKDTEKAETYEFGTALEVTSVDPAVKAVKDLTEGDYVDFHVMDSQLTKISVVEPRYILLEGTLAKALQLNDDVLAYEDSAKKLVAQYVDPNVQIQVEGLGSITVAELQKGDYMKLQMNGSTKRIEKITVTNRNIGKVEKAIVDFYNPASKFLTLKDQNGKPLGVYELTNRVMIKQDGSPIAVENFQNVVTAGKRVNYTVSNNLLISIELNSKLTATITNINTTHSSITVRTDSNEQLTYLYTNADVNVYFKSVGTISDLAIGDKIHLTLHTSNDTISRIDLETTQLLRTLAFSTHNRMIYGRDDSNNFLHTFQLESNVPVTRMDGTRAAFSDIGNFEPILLKLVGKNVSGVILPDTLRGQVVSVDTARNEMVVKDMTGRTQTVRIDKGVRITNGETSSTSISMLKAGDRIVAAQDLSGKYSITIAKAMQRTFSSYNSTNNEVLFKLETIHSTSRYNLHPKAYIHKSADTLTLSAFRDNEDVMVYLIDDQIVELEKK